MKEMMSFIGALALTLGALSSAHAQGDEPPPASPTPPSPQARPRLLIGAEFGSWRPTDARVQQLFGTSWQNFGLGFGPVSAPGKRAVVQPSLRVVQAAKGENRITLVPVGATWRKGLGVGGSYLGVSAKALFGRLEGPTLSGKWKSSAGAALFLGQSFGKKAYIEAGYSAYGKLDGFDVSGWNLSAGFRF